MNHNLSNAYIGSHLFKMDAACRRAYSLSLLSIKWMPVQLFLFNAFAVKMPHLQRERGEGGASALIWGLLTWYIQPKLSLWTMPKYGSSAPR
jgi:hypothetical protein